MAFRKKRRTGSLFLKLLAGVFAVYAVVTIVSLQLDINERKARIEDLEEQARYQKIINSELEEMNSEADGDEYYADIARDKLGYGDRNERIFVDVSGS